MRTSRGISTAVIAVIVVAIIAVAGAGAYFALSGGSSSSGTTESSSTTGTTTTTVSSGTSNSETHSTASASSTSTSSTAGPSTTSTTGVVPSVAFSTANVLGNFSQMDVRYSTSNSTYSSGAEFSFFTVGHPVVNGISTTEVNMSFESTGGASNSSTSFLLYFDHNWNVTMATVGGYNFTGIQASSFTYAFYGFFSFFSTYSTIWTQYSTDFSTVSSGSQTFGSVTMDVTTYSASSITYLGTAYGSFTISIGHIPNTNFSMLTKWSANATSAGGSSGTVSYELVSATRA